MQPALELPKGLAWGALGHAEMELPAGATRTSEPTNRGGEY